MNLLDVINKLVHTAGWQEEDVKAAQKAAAEHFSDLKPSGAEDPYAGKSDDELLNMAQVGDAGALAAYRAKSQKPAETPAKPPEPPAPPAKPPEPPAPPAKPPEPPAPPAKPPEPPAPPA